MTISIICPTLNEEMFIGQTIQSFLSQKVKSFNLEILIVDGRSTDRTRDIVKDWQRNHRNIRLLDNENGKTPFAFNIGLRESRGEYVAILGAHAEYSDEYLQVCYEELVRTHSVACTGRIVSKSPSESFQALAARWVMENPFGVSGSSFRTMKEGYTHSVGYPVIERKALLEVGGYDTSLFRNQDNDMNQRLIEAGHKLYCTWKTKCSYFTPPTLKKLYQYAYNNGYWNALSLETNRKSMRTYHFIPFIFLASLIFLFLIGILDFVLHTRLKWMGAFTGILFLYAFVSFIFALISMSKKADRRKLLLPLYFFAFHISYGSGTGKGVIDWIISKRKT